ncbi:sulfite exporter TauE/SafE family protein [Bosea sp. (in: a-proteobacteria)]|uniref:sulfite exporter TauE/SafE family protein n=1 Tax=Bosea sp. (in: a-proteobacteria) TaxID=1871050 RepID=UPI0039C874DF
MPDIASLGSGSLVGFTLGLVGGGGSILAVPLLVYVVGVASPHVAIGTSAVAVALSAFGNLLGHARAGHVRWPCALVFSAAGIAGAALGSALGKRLDGQKLLLVFGVLMLVIAAAMLLRRSESGAGFQPLGRSTAARLLPRLLGMGGLVGGLSGFFGIGGGFLIVPGLMTAANLPMIVAIGSSLVAVTAFGLTTATSYALSGLVDWHVAALFVAGGLVGGIAGTLLARRLSGSRTLLTRLFAGLVAAVGLYVIARGLGALA